MVPVRLQRKQKTKGKHMIGPISIAGNPTGQVEGR